MTDWLAPRRAAVDALIRRRLASAEPRHFREALEHAFAGGGKRIRPAIVFAAYDAFASDPDDYAPAIAPAAAVELVHTYSLVHDDLPCMDDDDVRRGRPTLHVAFGEAAAVLAGDALLTEAFAVLAEAPAPAEARLQMTATLARAAGMCGMVGGQAVDVGLGGSVGDPETLEALHAGKTGALITASAVLGGITAGAGDLGPLETWGRAVGLAFQLADDLLDAGGDGTRPSFVHLLGERATKERADALVAEALMAVRGFPRHDRLDGLARFAVERTH